MRRRAVTVLAMGLLLLSQVARADWTAAKRLTWTSGNSYLPATAIDSSNHIHVVWQDDTPGNCEVYYRRSTDGGTNWSAAKRLTWTLGYSQDPAIAIDSSNTIHVAWRDDTPGNYEIYHKKSTDGGATWSAPQRLTWTSGLSSCPAMPIVSSDTFHIVWFDYTPGNYEIYHKRSTDGGTTWGAAKRLTWTSGDSRLPAIATDAENTIHVAWQDYTPGNYEIYHKSSTHGGTTWSAAKRLTWTSGNSYSPAMAIDLSNTIHVAWEDGVPGNFEIYYKVSEDGGTTWSPIKRLTWTSGESCDAVLAIDSSNHIHLAWDDEAPGNPEIYHKKSTDGGATWSAADRLTWTSALTCYPAMATDTNNMVHVVWQDYTLGNVVVYYKKGN